CRRLRTAGLRVERLARGQVATRNVAQLTRVVEIAIVDVDFVVEPVGASDAGPILEWNVPAAAARAWAHMAAVVLQTRVHVVGNAPIETDGVRLRDGQIVRPQPGLAAVKRHAETVVVTEQQVRAVFRIYPERMVVAAEPHALPGLPAILAASPTVAQ